jgi:hypothetical protein
MSKKKKAKSPKKKSPRIKPRVLIAQKRNSYLRDLEFVSRATGTLAAFKLIPKREQRLMSLMRIKPPQIEAEPGHDIPKALLTAVREHIMDHARLTVFTTLPDGTQVNLYDYITVIFSFSAYLNLLRPENFKTAAEVKAGFAPFLEFVAQTPHPGIRLCELGKQISLYLNRIHRHFYWFNFTSFDKKTIIPHFAYGLSLNRQKAEKIDVDMGGKKRPAYRVGWAFGNEGIVWSTINARDLGIRGGFSDQPLKVYIQSHALIRLIERLDHVGETLPQLSLIESLTNLKTIRMADGSILIEYRLFDLKVGYLVIDILTGLVIIRTFLFLTNSGTPEGENLKKILGLQMEERKYLEIDKLSGFLLSDLKNDKNLIEIFTRAGCGSLFQFAGKGLDVDPQIKLAQKVAAYLRLHEEIDYE